MNSDVTLITNVGQIEKPGTYAPSSSPAARLKIDTELSDEEFETCYSLWSAETGRWLCNGCQCRTWASLGQVRRFLSDPNELRAYGLAGWHRLWEES